MTGTECCPDYWVGLSAPDGAQLFAGCIGATWPGCWWVVRLSTGKIVKRVDSKLDAIKAAQSLYKRDTAPK